MIRNASEAPLEAICPRARLVRGATKHTESSPMPIIPFFALSEPEQRSTLCRSLSSATVPEVLDEQFIHPIHPSRLALRLQEVSAGLADLTECLLALETPESWDLAHPDPVAEARSAARILYTSLGFAELQATRDAPEVPEDVELAEVILRISGCLVLADLRERGRAIIAAWKGWNTDSQWRRERAGSEADHLVRRLFYRLACYQDVMAGPQPWPLELIDPEMVAQPGEVITMG